MLHLTSLSLNLFKEGDLFLNESCRSDSKKKLIKDPWSFNSIEKSIEVEKLYEDSLEIIYHFIVNQTGINITKKGSRILFGDWLYSILISIYDRIITIKSSDFINSIGNMEIPWINVEEDDINFLSSFSSYKDIRDINNV